MGRLELFPLETGEATLRALLTDIFRNHWQEIVFGTLVQGAVFEIRFTAQPRISVSDGYLTVDPGAWHFHLCVNDHQGTPSPELARLRRVARAAFFRTEGGSHGGGHSTPTWGLRLWNGREEQMITVLFPNPYYDEDWRFLKEPRWEKTALWETLRGRYAGKSS